MFRYHASLSSALPSERSLKRSKKKKNWKSEMHMVVP